MDPVTHGLAGGLVARAGLVRRAIGEEFERRGVALVAACALAPDLDAIVEVSSDPLAFLRHHRGFTHSLLGGALLAMLLAVAFRRFFPGVPRRRVLALTAAGVYLHVLMDLLTSYGTVLLFPFRATRYTLDWMWTVDPTFTGILVGGLFGVWLLRRAPRRVAKAGIMLAAGYVLLCGGLQWFARHAVAAEARAQEIPGIREISAVPAPFVPLRWTGIVETDATWYRAHLDLGEGAGADIRFEPVPKIAPAAARQALEAVSRGPVNEQVELYRWFARFPVVDVERSREGDVVSFYDLRFDLPGVGPGARPYVFTVRLDRLGRVVGSSLE